MRRGTIDPGSSRTTRRLRRVEIDLGRVFLGGTSPSAARAADSLTLNLFPDVCVTAVREQATDLAGDKMQWVGQVKGAVRGKAILVVDDKLMVGTVTISDKVFQIHTRGRRHAVVPWTRRHSRTVPPSGPLEASRCSLKYADCSHALRRPT
jgi:hypothetical protein